KLRITSLTHLRREANMAYGGRLWDFRARALAFQTVDDSIALDDRPYDRVPQLSLSANPLIRPGRVNPLFQSELVNFERTNSLTGWRLNLQPGFSVPFRNAYGFITPTLSVKHIGYDLDLSSSDDDKPDVTAGIFSLDSGLFFERDMRVREGRYLHTLEPRLFYLRVPFEDQDDLPNFDTSLPDLTFDNLFRDNRFVGGDRVGDADQATLALTTRVIGADDGIERFRFSIGQIYFFDDRKVNLPPGIETDNTSDLVAELSGRFANKWYARGTISWTRDRRETQESSTFIQYQPAKDRILSMRHRLSRDEEFEQADLAVRWPVKRRWAVQAATKYSLRNDRNLESYAGFEYRSCCWAFRFFARRRINDEEEQVNSVHLQLELSGLGELGDVPDNPLAESVLFPGEDFSTRGPGYR
ncbi:MAG: LPS-assembly protein LptD, partial [Woeseiaceae bacterium]